MDINSPIVKILRLREDRSLSEVEKDEIEKYYIHYINQVYSLSAPLAARVSIDFCDSNTDFRQTMYNEIKNE